MKKRKIPEEFLPRALYVAGNEHLYSPDELDELVELLSIQSIYVRNNLINRVRQAAANYLHDKKSDSALTYGERRRMLRAIAKQARELRSAIDGLESSSKTLVYDGISSGCPHRQDETDRPWIWLRETSQRLNDVDASFSAAAQALPQTGRPRNENARIYVNQLALAYEETTGEYAGRQRYGSRSPLLGKTPAKIAMSLAAFLSWKFPARVPSAKAPARLAEYPRP